jgi:ubiquinone/menaquinone biosynthesis C-methylase UbiE
MRRVYDGRRHHEVVKAYYEARAREYDDWWLGRGLYAERTRPGWHEARDELSRWIAELPPARTLDVACGTGFMTRHLRGDVVGLDQSTAMVDVAREQAPNAGYVVGDALNLPFDDASFDRLFTSYFYCHLEEDNRHRFLAEARRVARELVVVASVLTEGAEAERWEERRLKDGSSWQVYKRVFVPDDLAKELGGRVLHANEYFVMVASP